MPQVHEIHRIRIPEISAPSIQLTDDPLAWNLELQYARCSSPMTSAQCA